jgi:hypothetical protein
VRTHVAYSAIFLLDVMTIADEVDSQLKQAMLSYVEPTTPWGRGLSQVLLFMIDGMIREWTRC